MNTVPRSPGEHYTAAERLLAAAPETPETAAALAVAHALLSLAPRRARRRPPEPARHVTGGTPRERWLRGHDDQEES